MSKRSSICSLLFHPGLKRKRQEVEVEEGEGEQCKRQKKNTVLSLIQRVIKPRKKKQERHLIDPEPKMINLFENFKLPVIEWTNGDLGILQEEEDSIFCINVLEYIEFPKPPKLTTIEEKEDVSSDEEEEDDDDDSTLLTATTTTTTTTMIPKELLSQIEKLNIK